MPLQVVRAGWSADVRAAVPHTAPTTMANINLKQMFIDRTSAFGTSKVGSTAISGARLELLVDVGMPFRWRSNRRAREYVEHLSL